MENLAVVHQSRRVDIPRSESKGMFLKLVKPEDLPKTQIYTNKIDYESLFGFLETTTLSLRYIEQYRPPKILEDCTQENGFLNAAFYEQVLQLEILVKEDMAAFNSLLRQIGGIPLKLIHNEDLCSGSLVASNKFAQGEWGVVFHHDEEAPHQHDIEFFQTVEQLRTHYNAAKQ